MAIETLEDLLKHEIRDLYNAQTHLQAVRPQLVERITDDALKNAMSDHMDATDDQVERLERCADLLEIDPTGVKCHAMDGLLSEARHLEEEATSEAARDAALLVAFQKIEHYEIASYGAAAFWAETLGFQELATRLKECVADAKEADQRLTTIAKDHVDRLALPA